MTSRFRYLALAGIAAAAACSDGPSSPDDEFAGELVITEGVAAPERVQRIRPAFSDASASANLGGGSTTPLTLKSQACEPGGQQVVVTYVVTGRQVNPASFKVNTRWEYDGASWSGSIPATVNVTTRPTGPGSDSYPVTLTVVNASAADAGSSSFLVAPFGLVTSAPAALNVAGGNVTIHVAFVACPVTNTAPVLYLPADMTVEATSPAGAVASYAVTASDAQDGILDASVTCTPASGSTYPLGATTVECSVTDAGGITVTGSFVITVVDTTPAEFTSFPDGTVTLIAANIGGAVLDVDALGITVADAGGVSEPATFACDYVAGTALAIGSTTTVDCTATDAIGNESDVSSFDVFVGLDVSATGFLPPLRMSAPFSAHKRGSTLPHKFLPPAYADGTPATDLAAGLTLVIRRIDALPDDDGIPVNDFSAGSTSWRYEATDGHYIFNLQTGTSTPWDVGTWTTTVSYAGIPLATTQFDFRR